MSYAGMNFTDDHTFMEDQYSLPNEAQTATLLTTGNGYMGVRGSLEEYGSLCIQGMMIRGVMDEVVEVRLAMCDNKYMKKYYIDEEKLKGFEKQERAINLLDFLLIRFEIDGEVFYPWEGTLHSWKRWLDLSDETLNREVVWENGKGQKSLITFQRFASFSDDHIYGMKASIKPLNYSGTVRILSGIDFRTKSNGQHPQSRVEVVFNDHSLYLEEIAGPKYGFHAVTGIDNKFSGAEAQWEDIDEDGLTMQGITFEAEENKTYELEKLIAIATDRDFEPGKTLHGGEFLKDSSSLTECIQKYLDYFKGSSYEEQYENHTAVYKDLMAKIETTIKGDKRADRVLRFCNYHTLLSLERNDFVHSFSAKGLTGEQYNDFVWWDAEIYQAPVFQQTMPEYSKNNILFRYSHLKEARELAKEQGYKGARFPFTTGVTGEETIWVDTRHPFMQVHCVSDVALSVLSYYTATGDDDLMLNYGMEILLDVCRYWVSRVDWNEEKQQYDIRKVTGTDEHHPYVDNDAYTNYSVEQVMMMTWNLVDQYGSELDELLEKMDYTKEEIDAIEDVAEKLYLPLNVDTAMIPQFDGYFDLSIGLELEGSTNAGYTQMKQPGLYHLSQIIKQPDVLVIFAYQYPPFSDRVLRRNTDYYLERCESSSSLAYCVHSVCCADVDMPESAYNYLMESAELDLNNLHGGTENGLHSGCESGAWLAVTRGLAGMKYYSDFVKFDPHFIPWWDELSFHSFWHGCGFQVTVRNGEISVKADDDNTGTLSTVMNNQKFSLEAGETATVKTKT